MVALILVGAGIMRAKDVSKISHAIRNNHKTIPKPLLLSVQYPFGIQLALNVSVGFRKVTDFAVLSI